jgi:hypothetical protein
MGDALPSRENRKAHDHQRVHAADQQAKGNFTLQTINATISAAVHIPGFGIQASPISRPESILPVEAARPEIDFRVSSPARKAFVVVRKVSAAAAASTAEITGSSGAHDQPIVGPQTDTG